MIRHLNRKGQVPDVLEEAQEHGNVVILEVPLLDHQVEHIQPANQRPGRDGDYLEGYQNQKHFVPCFAPGELVGHFVPNRHDHGHDLRDRQRADVDSHAHQVLLDERFLDPREDALGVGVGQHVLPLPLGDHIPQPLLAQVGVEEQPHRAGDGVA